MSENTISELVLDKKAAETAIAEIINGFTHKYGREVEVQVMNNSYVSYNIIKNTHTNYTVRISVIID